MIDNIAYSFETDMEKLVLGYYYRRKSLQEKYDKLHVASSRVKKKVLRKLKERKKKSDIKWKIANIVVRTAHEKQHAIVLEKLGKKAANSMIKRIKDAQLRHRIFQASFKGIQNAIEEKAREYGVPVVPVNPRNTSKLCPIHSSHIAYDKAYDNSSRIGKCSLGGELWHRDVAACWNILFRALRSNGSNAPSFAELNVDVPRVPFGANAIHDPKALPKGLWARWKSLPQKHYATVLNRMKR